MDDLKQQKIKYLDGLRGFAVLIVVIHHWVLAYYGAMYYLDPAQIHTKGHWEIAIGHSLFVGMYSGQAFVALLFLLSAYVLSYRFFLQKDLSIVKSGALRRYARLAVPNLISVLFAYIIIKVGWMQYGWEAAKITNSFWLDGFFRFEADFFLAFKQGLWDGFFAYTPELSYNPAMWTMAYELVGSFLVFSFLALFGRLQRRWIIYFAMLMLFYDSYYLAFVLGLMISDLHNSQGGKHFCEYMSRRSYFCWILVGIGYVLICYFDDNRNIWSTILNINILSMAGFDLWVFYHSLGAMFMFTGILFLPLAQKFFEGRLMQFLGRVTYSLYLTHLTILYSIGCYVFLFLLQMGFSYSISVSGSLVITGIASVYTAYVMTVFIDEPSIHFSRYLQKKLFSDV